MDAQQRIATERAGTPSLTVWVSLSDDKQEIVRRSRELGWRVVDLAFYAGNLPPGPSPQGVFVDDLPDDPLVLGLVSRGCKVVRLGRLVHPDDGRVSAVIPDRAAAGRLAAEYLSGRHFRSVGFICYREMLEAPNAAGLYESFRDRAGELGCDCHELVFEPLSVKKNARVPGPEKHWLRQAEFACWLQTIPKPIGLFTFGDNMAGRLSVTALSEGFEIPQQVAMLGYGGDRTMSVSAPVPLSTVDVGSGNRCDTAIRLMQDLMDGKPAPPRLFSSPP
jgi:DNA-binding LacI/PurR family transcriptional regulator